LESLQNALGHGFAVATKIGYTVFQSAVLKALFILDEEHLEMAIQQNVDLLPLFMIYAPQWVKYSRDMVARMGGNYENKITLQNSLKWLDEQCQKRHRRYYDIIVNLPGAVGSNPTPVRAAAPNAKDAVAKVYPPPGADPQRVEWWWGNVQRLTKFVFRGEVPESSKKYAIEHLKWMAQQKAQGTTSLDKLLKKGVEEVKSRQETEQNSEQD
jgi:hypothetical protein